MVPKVLLVCSLVMVGRVHMMKMAECTFENSLKGTVQIHFTNEKETDTMFMGKITNLSQGKHGFHVHEVSR